MASDSRGTNSKGTIGRPFAKGVSGNPGGRPKSLQRRVRELVGEDGDRIVAYMVSVLDDPAAPRRDRMQAAEWLADRGWGRAVQSVEQRVEHAQGEQRPLPELSDAELRQLAGLDDETDLTTGELQQRYLRKRYDELPTKLDDALDDPPPPRSAEKLRSPTRATGRRARSRPKDRVGYIRPLLLGNGNARTTGGPGARSPHARHRR
jgi:hypothetical protein